MEPSTINSFLDQFLGLAESGFGLIQGDVGYVLNALIVISITLAGAQWALAQEAPMAPFFRKVLFVGLFAFLVNNWSALASAINESGAMLGLKAGGGSLSMAALHDPGHLAGIGGELFGKTIALGEGMNIFSDAFAMATIFLAAVCVMIAFFVLAVQLFVALIAFKLGSLAAFVALPWGIFNGTAWVAERPLGWVAGSAIRLFVLAFIASVAVNFVDALPETFTLDTGGVLNVMLFGLTILALAWFGPALAGEVVQGQPSLSGVDAIRSGQSAVATTAGVAVASKILLSGSSGGGLSSRSSARRGSSALPSIDHSKFRPKPKSGGRK